MKAVQVSRVTFPLMLSLFLGASSSIWPLVPAGKSGNNDTDILFLQLLQKFIVKNLHVFIGKSPSKKNWVTFGLSPINLYLFLVWENTKSHILWHICTKLKHLPSSAAFQLPPCQLINQTVSLEKEGCPKCHPVETTICSGHCITKVL